LRSDFLVLDGAWVVERKTKSCIFHRGIITDGEILDIEKLFSSLVYEWVKREVWIIFSRVKPLVGTQP
jgi:hypothetical protein